MHFSASESLRDTGQDGRQYHVGVLSYFKRGLVILFAWMRWGDFFFTLMESVVPSILPTTLKAQSIA